MSVFRPKKPNEPWGIKFWSDQLVRYACYTLEDGTTMGDIANKTLTKYLIEKKLWVPPEPRTQHDVLPVVFKIPGRDEPIVHQFDDKYVDEAEIVHPDYPEIAQLGHKWAAVPAINVFNMNLGGVEYGCMPFNGWFCSIEIVRNIMERYEGANEKWAAALGIDTKNHRMWKARVAHEIDVAVLHSFDKAGYTIVDPETVGEQFMAHCKRERESGRECPAQWSWIGGLTGPTNKTWHKEMRDFRKDPQYEYCAEQWSVTGYNETFPDEGGESAAKSSSVPIAEVEAEEIFKTPNVLIAYGSETGTAEAAAGRLARALRILKPAVFPLNKIAGLEIVKKRKVSHLLVLCSTFGKGKAPTSASKFVETEIPNGLLQDTKIATLALGSTMYPDFCMAGKFVDKMLLKAGGQKLIPITTADEAVDSSGTVAQWIKLVKNIVLPTRLEQAIEARSGAATEPLQYSIKWQKSLENGPLQKFTWPDEVSSECLINEELLVGGDVNERSTRRIGFKVPFGSSYTTGDHLCVHPLNNIEVVKRFAKCFIDEFLQLGMYDKDRDTDALVEWQLQQPFEIDCIDNGHVYPAQLVFATPTTLGDTLQSGIGLSLSEGNVSDVIGVITEYVDFKSDDTMLTEFKEISAAIMEGSKGEAHQKAMDKFLSLYPTVVDLLEVIVPCIKDNNPDKPIPLAHLLSILPRLQPRLYSISSSSTTSPDVVEVSLGVVHAVTNDKVKIAGVCSNYLARLVPGKDRAKISIRASSFRGPEDLLNTPMIMVGAGTGLAVRSSSHFLQYIQQRHKICISLFFLSSCYDQPMMGFLQDRAHAIQQAGGSVSNDTHLFFGCRTHDERMYRTQIEDWETKKVLNLHLALSRDDVAPKMYVQNLIKEKGALLCDLLSRDNCRYYVCGDARMADFCYEAMVEALREHGHMSRSKATEQVKRMRVQDHWQYDLWGISAYMDEGSYSDAKRKIAKRNGNRALTWLSKMNKANTDDDW